MEDCAMQEETVPFQRMVFVCVNERDPGLGVSCGPRNGVEIHRLLKEGVKSLGKAAKVRVCKSGCLDRCAKGPNVMVFPDNLWFHGVTEADVPAILERIVEGL